MENGTTSGTMKDLVAGFAAQLTEAQAAGLSLPEIQLPYPVQNVYVLGLGGSAFGAEIVAAYCTDRLRVPFLINRTYGIPAAVGPNTLVIASSYSGNTEETLEAASEAQKQGAHVVCITSGGELAAWAGTHGFLVLRVPTGFPPRAAVGFSIVLQLYLLAKVGLIDDPTTVVNTAITAIENYSSGAVAQAVADGLVGRIPVLYTGDQLAAIGLRLRQQLNENSKRLCWHHVLPEMNHNELVGWEGPDCVLSNATVVLLRSNFEHPQVAKRFAITEEIVRSRGVSAIHTVKLPATQQLEELLLLLHHVDWISVYLAETEGTDALPVAVIDHLKGSLKQA